MTLCLKCLCPRQSKLTAAVPINDFKKRIKRNCSGGFSIGGWNAGGYHQAALQRLFTSSNHSVKPNCSGIFHEKFPDLSINRPTNWENRTILRKKAISCKLIVLNWNCKSKLNWNGGKLVGCHLAVNVETAECSPPPPRRRESICSNY